MSIILPEVKLSSSVGILGGSFDPPHLGHEMLALAALATTPIDRLWVVPCADHAFQKSLTPFKSRYEMCLLAFDKIKNISVLDIENLLPKPNYSIHTVRKILELRPDLKLSLIMGSDLMQDFDQWNNAEELRALCQLCVFDRSKILPDARSSEIKQLIKTGDFSNLDSQIQNYILKNRLY